MVEERTAKSLAKTKLRTFGYAVRREPGKLTCSLLYEPIYLLPTRPSLSGSLTCNMSYKLGYVGLGALGSQICIHLAKHASESSLPPVSIWNRSKDKYAPIQAAVSDVHCADEVEEIAGRCNVVFTCLANDAAAVETYGKMFNAVKAKVVFVDQTTINPKTSGECCRDSFRAMLMGDLAKLATQAKEVGCVYLACPVFGQPAAAKAGQLVCIVSGQPDEREFVKPLLAAVGRKTLDVGDDVTKGKSMT